MTDSHARELNAAQTWPARRKLRNSPALWRRAVDSDRDYAEVTRGGVINDIRLTFKSHGHTMSEILSQSEVLQRLEGDGDNAVAELFSMHRERLLKLVTFRLDARLKGRVDPDDILQEAYLDAAQRIRHFTANPVTTIFVWFRLIVMQTMTNVHRRHLGTKMRDASLEAPKKRQSDSGSTVASITQHLTGHLTSPSQAAIREEQTRQLMESLEDLAELDREILALRHFEELTNAEAAEVLGIEAKTASVRYFRAIRRLRGVLEKMPGFN